MSFCCPSIILSVPLSCHSPMSPVWSQPSGSTASRVLSGSLKYLSLINCILFRVPRHLSPIYCVFSGSLKYLSLQYCILSSFLKYLSLQYCNIFRVAKHLSQQYCIFSSYIVAPLKGPSIKCMNAFEKSCFT